MNAGPHPGRRPGPDQPAADVRAAGRLVSAHYPEATGAVLGGSG